MNSCGSFFFFSVFEAFTITWLPAQTQLYHSNIRDGPKWFQSSNSKMILLYSLFHVLFIDGLWHFESCSEACVVSRQERFRALGAEDLNSTGSWYLFLFRLFACVFPPIKYNLNQTEAHNSTKIIIDIQKRMYFTFQHIINLVQMPYQRSVRKSIFPSFMLASLKHFEV